MSDTPRTDEERQANLLESFRIINKEYEESQMRISEAVEKLENATSYEEVPQSLYDALAILKGEQEQQKFDPVKTFDKMVEEEVEPEQDDRPRFKPGDRVWRIYDGKAIEVELKSLIYYHEDPDVGFNAGCQVSSCQIFATKEELIESL